MSISSVYLSPTRLSPPDPEYPYLIYGLCDPRDGVLRYVGKTVNAYYRHWRHCDSWRNEADTCHRVNWIRSLARQGVTPALQVLIWVSRDDWKAAEAHFITVARAAGCDLTNTDEAGHGGRAPGFVMSEMQRQAISRAHKARGLRPSLLALQRSREAMAAASAERRALWQQKANLKRGTPEYRAWRSKTSQDIVARPGMRETLRAATEKSRTPEARKKNSEKVKARWADADYRERTLASHARWARSDEGKRVLSEAKRAVCARPGERERMSERARHHFSDPTARAQTAEKTRHYWASLTPEQQAARKQQLAEARKRRWLDRKTATPHQLRLF